MNEKTRDTIRMVAEGQIVEANHEGALRYGNERKITFKQEMAYRLRHQDFFGLNVREAAKIMGISVWEINNLLRKMREIAPQLFPILPPRMSQIYRLFMEGYRAGEIAERLNVKTVRYVRRVLRWLWVRRQQTGVYFRSGAGRRISYETWMDTYTREKF